MLSERVSDYQPETLSVVHLSAQNHLYIMRNVLFIFTLVVLNVLSATAQDETRFYSKASATEVAVGESIQVSFVLENGKNNGRISPIDWEAAGFLVLGTSQSSNISINNGQTSASASYHYTVTPIAEGAWTIPSASIKNGEEELYTEPIVIQAVPNPDGTRQINPRSTPERPKDEPRKRLKTIRM